MCRLFRRAAALLLAASAGVGLGRPTPARADNDSPSALEVTVPTPAQSELERMKVELAWLADPTCSAQKLNVKVIGSALQVSGTLPDDGAKKVALQVARQNSFLPVRDALSVDPPKHAQTPEDLRQAASEALINAYGPRAAGYDLRVAPGGRITIHGSIGSVEDKVKVSRTLRRLPGCTCVVNMLGVPTVNRDGQEITLVSADGQHVVGGPLPGQAEAAHEMKPVVIASDDFTSRLPRVSSAQPGPAAAPQQYKSASARQRSSQFAAGFQVCAEHSNPTPVSIACMNPADGITPPRPTFGGSTPVCLTDGSYSHGSYVEQPPCRPSLWERITARYSTPRVSATVVPYQPPAEPVAQPMAVAQPVAAKPMVITKLPDAGSPIVWPPAYATGPMPARSATIRPVSSSTSAVVPASTQVAAKPAPAKAQPENVTMPSSSSVSPAPVHFHLRFWRPTATEGDLTAAQLKKAAQQACGSAASSVEVVSQPDHTLLVRVHVKGPAAEKQATEALLHAPQIAAPNVRLEVAVQP
jgi:hypothetical protein